MANKRISWICSFIKKLSCKPVLIWILLVIFVKPVMISAAAVSHPSLIFHDITETQGYQRRLQEPWKKYEENIMADANEALTKTFSDVYWKCTADNTDARMKYASEHTRILGLAYQITKDTRYAQKAKEAILNMDLACRPYPADRAWGVRDYSLAYDWIQPYLDPAGESSIRDKIANLAGECFKELTLPGLNIWNIGFPDYHGIAYPSIGFAGLVLQDYTNPNNIPLLSMPSDWVKVSTDYLFVNDTLHNYSKPLINVGFDEAGKHLDGGYKPSIVNEFVWWFQAYSHFYARNIFDVYPIAKKAFLSDIWESLPNYYANSYCTNDNTKYFHQKGFINLLDPENRSYAVNYVDKVVTANVLPYSNRLNPYLDDTILYIVYGDYSSIQRKDPPWTSHLDQKSIYQVFRKNWNEDSDWLSLITFNVNTDENRNMAHHDQLSLEYYTKGDLLLADGGENKYVMERIYGQPESYHNTIAIENPRVAFPLSVWADSPARGIYKGYVTGLHTSATIRNIVQTSWMEFINANTIIKEVLRDHWADSRPITDIQYERSVFYPGKDHFIIVDRLKGTDPWIYRNIFRPTSFNIVPSIGVAESQVGHVKGDLAIGGTPYNWLSLPYKKETATGITTNSIKWNTKNLYGKDVNLHLFSVPRSEILVTKHVGRVGGPDKENEVFQPLVYFRTAPKNDLYRITVLLSKYSTENEKTPAELNVSGNGNAIKITASEREEYIYSGEGVSSFGPFSTDADTAYASSDQSYTLVNGAYLNYSGATLIAASRKIDYLTLKKTVTNTIFRIKGTGTVDITLAGFTAGSCTVKKDGGIYTNYVKTGSNLVITSDLSGSEHEFVIIPVGGDAVDPLITITSPADNEVFSISSITVNGAASDNVELNRVEVKVNDAGSWQLAGGTTLWSKAITLSAGSNTIYVKATDTSGNTRTGSVTVIYQTSASDTTPPAAITTLTAGSPTANSVVLSWMSTGDDGNSGTAAQYDIRYGNAAITESNWAAATQVSGEPAPAAADSLQLYTVQGLSAGATYYFAIKAADEASNWSAVSNSPKRITLVLPAITVTSPNGGESFAGGSQQTVTWISAGAVGNVEIAISTNAGTTWSTIIANTANDGSQAVIFPNTASTICRMRVQEPDGLPTDVSNGNFTITAAPVLTTITVSPATASIIAGGTQAFTATAKDQNGNTMTGITITWTSSNAGVAPVNASGTATGVAAGAATITASSGGKSGTAALTVTAVSLGPVGSWKLDETVGSTALDSSGNNNAGSLYGNPARTAGILNNGLSFDGVDDYVEILKSPTLDSVTSRITAAGWVKTSRSARGLILEKWLYGSTSDRSYLLTVEADGSFQFLLSPDGAPPAAGTGALMSSARAPLNTWTHVAAVSDGTTMMLYINGVRDTNTAVSPAGGIYAGNANLHLGVWQTKDTFFSGVMDEVKLYARDLSAAEILADYNAGAPALDTTPPAISDVLASQITSNSAAVTWSTDEASDSQVEYGVTAGYGSSTALNTGLVTSHSQSLTGLSASTLYYYRVKSKDAAGNPAIGQQRMFTTAASTPTINRSPATMSFSGQQSGANPANQTLSISNTGGGTLNWTVSDNAAWLSLSPASGSSTGETDAVAVSVNTAGLSAGTYTGNITIAAAGAGNTPQTVSVTLMVAAVPAITVTSPNGGETLTGGSQRTVTWTSAGAVGNVNIDISVNAGDTWTTLIANTANDGSQAVIFPNTASTICRIRVQEPDGLPSDASNNNFTITTVSGYKISGKVQAYKSGLGISGLSGVTLTLSGKAGAGYTTKEDGNYEFVGLAGGDYSIMPVKSNWRFWPKVMRYTGLHGDKAGQNFMGRSLSIRTTINSLVLTPTSLAVTPLSENSSEASAISVLVPEGAFSATTDLILTAIEAPVSDVSSMKVVGYGISIVSDLNLQPVKDIAITMTYDKSLVSGYKEEKLVVGRYDEVNRRWIALPTTRYPSESKVVGLSDHLSRFALLELLSADDLSAVKAYPNPYNPARHPQGMKLEGLTAGAVVKIYTVTGGLIRELQESGNLGSVSWDGKNESGKVVASGVYIAHIKGVTGVKKIKLAVEK